MGIISNKVHTVIGLIVGVLLLLAPSLLQFNDNGVASIVTMLVGGFIILNELITTSPFSPLKLVPMKVHVILDVMTGVFLLASPWIFGFWENGTQYWVPHLIVGAMVVGYALMTSTSDDDQKSIARS